MTGGSIAGPSAPEREVPVLRTAPARLVQAQLVLAALVLVAGCTASSQAGPVTESGPAEAGPRLGQCRNLSARDVDASSNASPVVACTAKHTAETFVAGTFPAAVSAEGRTDPALGGFVYDRCQPRFRAFVGADDSLLLRSTLSWAWFRPSAAAWKAGQHTYRCDVTAGGAAKGTLATLPTSAEGLLLGKPDDRWLTCVDGPRVSGAAKIPCSSPHTWRAVTTIVLGAKDDPYPGDRLSEVRTRDYCSDSVGAWLNYPVDYDYGYTWFHAAEWKTGNRRSVCWARTTQ